MLFDIDLIAMRSSFVVLRTGTVPDGQASFIKPINECLFCEGPAFFVLLSAKQGLSWRRKKNQIKPKFQKFLFILNYSLVVITSFMLSHICSLNLTSFSTTIHLLNQKKKPTTITRSLSPKTLGSIMNFQQIKKELVEIYSFLSFYYF